MLGIPLEERHKEKNIHFLAASEKVDLLKLAELVVDDIKVSQRYNYMYSNCVNTMNTK